MVETSLEYFRSGVPAGRSGEWVVEKVVLPQREYDQAADPRPDFFKYRPGSYTCLRRGSVQFMTDLYDEWWTQRQGIDEALARGGEVLVTGLGLGLVVEAILQVGDSPVERVTVLEQSADVIRLVAPHLQTRFAGKVEVIAADAFGWRPADGRRFSVAWHDIWANPYGAETAAEIERLREWHRPWCDWQGFWPETYLAAAGDGEDRPLAAAPIR